MICSTFKPDPEFVCQRCRGVACPIDGRPVTHVDVDGTQLDVEATFCYLGDIFSAGGGCDHAIAARCCAAWGKFRKLFGLSAGCRCVDSLLLCCLSSNLLSEVSFLLLS